MRIVHFDVDEYIGPYLIGEKHHCSLGEAKKTEDIEILSINSKSRVTKETLGMFPRLRFIVTRSVGMDHIDLSACEKRGVTVRNIPDYGSQNIAELSLGLMLDGCRSITKAHNATQTGIFTYRPFFGIGLKGKTIGIVGTGRIGLALIRLLSSFQARIIAFDVSGNNEIAKQFGFSYVSLTKLLEESDIISLHVPLLPTTNHLIGKNEIMSMKQNAVLVNTSRGEIIDTKELLKQIKKFKAVCLDVLEEEDRFNKNNPLLKCDNVFITPHIGFFTDCAIRSIGEQTQLFISQFKPNEIHPKT